MSAESVVYDETFESAEDLSSAQYTIVESTGRSQGLLTAGLCTGATGLTHCMGVLQAGTTGIGRGVPVRLLGLSKIIGNGGSTAITIGAPLTSTTDGKAIVATSQNQKLIGRALQGTTAAAGVIEAWINPVVPVAAT